MGHLWVGYKCQNPPHGYPWRSLDPWQEAVGLVLSKTDINAAERDYFNSTTKENLIDQLKAIDKTHHMNSTARSVSERIAPFVECILQYASALDVLANIQPMPMSIIWGAMRIVLQLAQSFEKYFDKLIAMFERISDVLPRFDLYIRLFPGSEGLVTGISRVYCDIVQFCLQARDVFRKRASPLAKRLRIGTSATTLMKLSWQNFDVEFGSLLEKFREHKSHVENEAKAAAMEDGQLRFIKLEDQGQKQISTILEIQKLQEDMRDMYSTLEGKEASKEWDGLLSWLGGGTGYKTVLRKLLAIRSNGTGEWLFADPIYAGWSSSVMSSTNVLWLYGAAGTGKSVLCSTVIDTLSSSILYGLTPDSSSHHMVLYHFCDFRDQTSTRSTNILGCLLRQALEYGQFKELKESDQKLLKARQHQGGAFSDDFADELEMYLEDSLNQAYIIIDALDECVDPDQIVTRLVRLASKKKVKVLFASRDVVDIRGLLAAVPQIILTPGVLQNDIHSFIEAEVARLIKGNKLKIRDQSLAEVVVVELSQMSDGMFLWAKFQLEDLCRKRTDRAIREAIHRLPQSLIATYKRCISKLVLLSEDERDLVKRLFQWAAFGARPMSTKELSICLMAVSKEMAYTDEESIITDPLELPALSNGLLTVESSPNHLGQMESYVVLPHRSILEFLTSVDAGPFLLVKDSTHAHIADTCLTYLLFDSFNLSESWDAMATRYEDFPFLNYAAHCWPTHIKNLSTTNSDLLDLLFRLFTGANFLPWLQVYKSVGGIKSHETFHQSATPLYWASRLGLLDLVKLILPTVEDINETGGFFGTALHMAAYNGDVSMVTLLLDSGANVNSLSGHFSSPMEAAAVAGHDQIVGQLLDAGADSKAKGGAFGSPLEAAQKLGHTSVVKLLLKSGAEFKNGGENVQDTSTLADAITRKDLSAVSRLILAGVNVNQRISTHSDSKDTIYPLILAIEVKANEILECLIKAGADVDVSDGYHGTALAFAGYWGNERAVHLLLQAGANPMPPFDTYGLRHAARYIGKLDKATADKMNNGRGLSKWVNDVTPESLQYADNKHMLNVLDKF